MILGARVLQYASRSQQMPLTELQFICTWLIINGTVYINLAHSYC